MSAASSHTTLLEHRRSPRFVLRCSGTRAGCAHCCDHCSLLQVQKDVAALLKGRILVGHAVFNDLKVLMLDHPRTMTRDTAFFPPFCKPPRRPVRMLVCRHY